MNGSFELPPGVAMTPNQINASGAFMGGHPGPMGGMMGPPRFAPGMPPGQPMGMSGVTMQHQPGMVPSLTEEQLQEKAKKWQQLQQAKYAEKRKFG